MCRVLDSAWKIFSIFHSYWLQQVWVDVASQVWARAPSKLNSISVSRNITAKKQVKNSLQEVIDNSPNKLTFLLKLLGLEHTNHSSFLGYLSFLEIIDYIHQAPILYTNNLHNADAKHNTLKDMLPFQMGWNKTMTRSAVVFSIQGSQTGYKGAINFIKHPWDRNWAIIFIAFHEGEVYVCGGGAS